MARMCWDNLSESVGEMVCGMNPRTHSDPSSSFGRNSEPMFASTNPAAIKTTTALPRKNARAPTTKSSTERYIRTRWRTIHDSWATNFPFSAKLASTGDKRQREDGSGYQRKREGQRHGPEDFSFDALQSV